MSKTRRIASNPHAAVGARLPGRPQDQALDDAILQATLRGLSQVGYERLSVEAVARDAGTAKTSIYRRWPDKEALVTAAVRAFVAESLDGAQSEAGASLRDDLLARARRLAAILTVDRVAVLAGLLLAIRTNRTLGDLLREALVQGEVSAMSTILDRAVARGEMNRPVAQRSGLILHVLPAVLFVRLFVLGDVVDEPFLTRVVDEVVLPLLQQKPDARRRAVRRTISRQPR
jgi:AcrR family transcriptional regulator